MYRIQHKIEWIVAVILFSLVLSGCSESLRDQDGESPEKSLEFGGNTSNQHSRVRIENAWNAPVTIDSSIADFPFGGFTFSVVTNSNSAFFAAWESVFATSKISTRIGIDQPWDNTAPTSGTSIKIHHPQVYSNPRSSHVFVTWRDPEQALGIAYVSRYSPNTGWSAPLSFSDSYRNSTVTVADDGSAVLAWLNYAENGTAELHARRFDTQGNLSLRDSLIIGEPGGFIGYFDSIKGLITADGDIELYWIDNSMDFSDPVKMTSTLQVWHTTYSPAIIGAKAWAQPEKIPKAKFFLESGFGEFQIVTDTLGNMTFIIQPINGFDVSKIYSLEFKNGAWGEITSIVNSSSPTLFGSSFASNSMGQAVIIWSELASTEPTPRNILLETQVFSRIYNINSGWSEPVQISNSTPFTVLGYSWGTGDEPKVSINEAGQIAAAWINPLENNKNLYANHYDPITGWNGEELASTTNMADNNQNTFSITMANNGDTTILWLEMLLGADGVVTVNTQSVDHVGAGNGVAISTNDIQIQSLVNPLERFNIRKVEASNIQVPKFNTTLALSKEQLVQAANPPPLGINSGWDEPKIIDSISEPLNAGMIINPLHIISNDLGDATAYFFTSSSQNTLVNFIWSGNVLNGGWSADTTPLTGVDPDFTLINDLELDSSTGDIYLGWGVMCPDRLCVDFYVSRKPAGGVWGSSAFLGRGAGGALDIVSSASKIGATWLTSVAPNTTEIGYSQYTVDTSWSAPELFTPQPSAATGNITPLSHSRSILSSAMNDNGVLSVAYDSFANLTTNTTFFSQHDPIAGWIQKTLPANTSVSSMMGGFYLSSTGTDNSAHLIVSGGLSSGQTQIISHQFLNEGWNSGFDVTNPKKGLIMSAGIEFDASKADGNSKGNMLIAWSEEVIEGLTPTIQIRMNQFDSISGWGQAQDVGFPIPVIFNPVSGPFSGPNMIEFLRVSLNESGQGAIAWTDTSTVNHALNIAHIDLAKGTNIHEIVYSIDSSMSNFVALDLHVDSLGRAILVWDERTESATENTHVIKTTTHHAAGSIQPTPVTPPEIPQPNVPSIPAQTAGWSSSEIAWEYPAKSMFSDWTLRPNIIAIGSSPTIAIQVNKSLDIPNKKYMASEYAVTSAQAPGLWQTSSPFMTLSPDATSNVQLVADVLNQVKYALWYNQQQLYINHQSTVGSWGTPTLVSNNATKAHLLTNNQGQTVVTWQTIDAPSAVRVSTISLNSAGIISVLTSEPSIQAASILSSTPAINMQGKIAFLRKSTGSTRHELFLSQFQIGGNWLVPAVQNLNADGFYSDSVNLAMTSGGEIVVFAQSVITRSLQSSSLQADGSWSSWIDLPASNSNAVLVGQYRLGTSSTGQLYVLWVEEVIDAGGEPKNNVMFSSYLATDLPAGNPWQEATLITQIPFPNFQETPLLLVANDGAAAVVWRYPIVPIYADGILIKKYYPTTGWQTASEYAATPSMPASMHRINADLSDTGDIFIIWEALGNELRAVPHAINLVHGKL